VSENVKCEKILDIIQCVDEALRLDWDEVKDREVLRQLFVIQLSLSVLLNKVDASVEVVGP